MTIVVERATPSHYIAIRCQSIHLQLTHRSTCRRIISFDHNGQRRHVLHGTSTNYDVIIKLVQKPGLVNGDRDTSRTATKTQSETDNILEWMHSLTPYINKEERKQEKIIKNPYLRSKKTHRPIHTIYGPYNQLSCVTQPRILGKGMYHLYSATSRILQLPQRFCVTDRAGVQLTSRRLYAHTDFDLQPNSYTQPWSAV